MSIETKKLYFIDDKFIDDDINEKLYQFLKNINVKNIDHFISTSYGYRSDGTALNISDTDALLNLLNKHVKEKVLGNILGNDTLDLHTEYEAQIKNENELLYSCLEKNDRILYNSSRFRIHHFNFRDLLTMFYYVEDKSMIYDLITDLGDDNIFNNYNLYCKDKDVDNIIVTDIGKKYFSESKYKYQYSDVDINSDILDLSFFDINFILLNNFDKIKIDNIVSNFTRFVNDFFLSKEFSSIKGENFYIKDNVDDTINIVEDYFI